MHCIVLQYKSVAVPALGVSDTTRMNILSALRVFLWTFSTGIWGVYAVLIEL
jgi:hypothetical protein